MTCPDCERLRMRVTALEGQLQERERSIAELKRRLALYENPNTPPSRRRYPRRPRRGHDGRRFPGRPEGHPGSTRPRPKPGVVQAPAWKDRCERCGTPLGVPSAVHHHIVEEISNPAPRQVIDFLEYEWACGACGSHTRAKHPDCPPQGLFGKNVLVQTTLMKFEERLPHTKVCEALERTYGVSITPATSFDITRRVSEWLRPAYEGILHRIRCADVVYSDETGVKVDGRQYWTWAFTTQSATVVAIRKSRGKTVLKEILGEDFTGVVVCDGWKPYASFTRRIQRCWAHLLREARYLAERIDEAKPLSQALHALYQRINVSPEDRPPPDDVVKLVAEATSILERWAGRPYQTEAVRRFAGKIRNGIDHWFTFLTTPGVEPTNNRAERALREHVVQRKIIGTLRNGKGTRIYETIMTLLAVWKQQGRNLSQALAETLTQEWTKS